jgi:hypothetical protein
LPATFELNAQTWLDPSQKGYFAFFPPAVRADWGAFATSLRAQFEGTNRAQFGWFDAGGTVIELVIVNAENTGAAFVFEPFELAFGSIVLSVQADPSRFQRTPVSFDDGSNSILFSNENNVIQLTTEAPGQKQTAFTSPSPNLVLPLDDFNDNTHAGSVNAAFQFSVADLAAFEAGFMYFGGAANALTALSYPLLRAPGGAAASLNFSGWFDVTLPLNDVRSYFQCTDATVGSYYATANGKAIALKTTGGSDLSAVSRLAFANRPVHSTTDSGTACYLTPAGSFTLQIDGDASATAAELLCGATGTEYLNAVLPADSLFMKAGQPAFQKTTPSGQWDVPPQFLDSEGGNVTTSWVQFVTTAGSYVSQPQDAPLYQQNGGKAPANSLSLYLLDFLPLLAWKSGGSSGPLVPMVPYGGLTAANLAAYLSMETEALNPTRKNALTLSPALKTSAVPAAVTSNPPVTWAMTPQGLFAGLDANGIWVSTKIALSPGLGANDPPVALQFTDMGDAVRKALQQNQIFLVISSLTAPDGTTLFGFDDAVNIGGWPFRLSPTGTHNSDGVPPIVILKFYPGQSISNLVNDPSLWSQADTFNTSAGFSTKQAQTYIRDLIQSAGNPDPSSLYYNFVEVVSDPNFSGMLALNCNMQLNSLPTAIRAVTGGMIKPGIDAFRAHHVGVAINDTEPGESTPTLAQSAFFALVDYEADGSKGALVPAGIAFDYGFEVEYVRALFSNASLSSFACKINLTINKLFGASVSDGSDNIIVISGSYQAHSTSGDSSTSGEGLYSFVAEKTYTYNFTGSGYLDSITLTKLQFTFQQETETSTANTTNLQAAFGIWGSMKFKELNALDVFSFEQLTFDDLGISVSFDLTVNPPASPSTSNLTISFNPGNLRVDAANSPSKPADGKNSMLSMLPFKLTSFFYNQHPERQTLEDLQYFALLGNTSIPLDPGYSLTNQFSYGLAFNLDLGTLGALVGSLEAFKFRFLIGWLEPTDANPNPLQIAFGVQLPQVDGKLEIKIQGILDLLIEDFKLDYVTPPTGPHMLVLLLHNSSIQILGQRLPPGTAQFDFALFSPADDASRTGWIVAINNEPKSNGAAPKQLTAGDTGAGGDGNSAFQLMYLGLGQRVGPDPTKPPTTFKGFLDFMTGDFWDATQKSDYDSVYHADGQWLALTHFKLLDKISVGFVFYDVTPFYSLTLSVEKLFDFEITYTKISDSIGLFYAELTLPDNLRTFQVGAVSLTLPSLQVSVYTNGDWKVNLGFPNGDDWSGCFRVQAQAGPVPVTGAGGFYIASLSSATSKIFSGNYPSILAFGFAARLGVGKDFTAGPLKAGVSVTFFGIIQGAAGYLTSGGGDIFKSPDALSLQGQFGIIGELYGKIDFVIIKASVNVRLQASIGIILLYEFGSQTNTGSILLYIEASVRVSVSVEINFLFFSVTISFSFNASFRFQWQLAGSGGGSQSLLAAHAALIERSPMLTVGSAAVLPLIQGFNASLPIWYLPEGTVTFTSSGPGTPWVVSSLGVEYDNNPAGTPGYSTFKPFEQMTTQLATWAVGHALNLPGSDYTVTEDQLASLDSPDPSIPNPLVAWIDYPSLLAQLAVFASTTVILPPPPADPNTKTLFAATFPMLPFFNIKTTGRQGGDVDFVFSSKNNVPPSYITDVDKYFNQLFVNQSGSNAADLTSTLSAGDDTDVPLIQEIFLNYFTGLIRGAVHQLLQTMQDLRATSMPINTLVSNAVGRGNFAALSGQMSSSFRGGVRLPNSTDVTFTLPDGSAPQANNALYALLWQQIPTGSKGGYTIDLTNPEKTESWITSSVSWPLTAEWLTPYQAVNGSDIVAPSSPVQLPFTNIGPQAFAFANPVPWTPASNPAVNLCPFPSALQRLQANGNDINVVVESRETGAPYLGPRGTILPSTAFFWATQITLNVIQIPDGRGGSLPDVFSLAGSSQSDQQLLEQILNGQVASIAAIRILYQTAAGASGVISDNIDPSEVFVLRTNTTTVSSPPPAALNMFFAVETAPPAVPVGAHISETTGFLQIVQQAAVTNATGYYLRYSNSANKSLPPALFSGGPAPLTILITYNAPPASATVIRPFYNAIVFNAFDTSLTYYTETTDPALDIQYSAVAPGAVGALLTRSDSSMLMRPHTSLLASTKLQSGQGYRLSEMIGALAESGVTDETALRSSLDASNSTVAYLNSLYSLVTYQVAATPGSFVQSNLSAPIQAQKPEDSGDPNRSYRIYAPLYNLAEANQGVPNPNRYAAIGAPVSINFFQNDAFGNQMPAQLQLSGVKNLYFDPIVALDQWQGVVTAYDFNPASPAANTFNVSLIADATAFDGMTKDQAAAALQAWTTIYDQITGPGVSFVVETNLALQPDGSMTVITLSQSQADQIVAFAKAMVDYLGTFPLPSGVTLPTVTLSLSVSGTGTLPPAFELSALFQIQRDASLLSPLIKDSSGNVTFPAAETATSAIVSTVGRSLPDGSGTVQISDFAAAFVKAFPQLALAVGLNGAGSSSSQQSSVAKRRLALQSAGVASDGSSSGSGSRSLWAVQRPMLDVTIGGPNNGPFFSSPMPLDNTLNTATVSLPLLPPSLVPPNTTWPSQQLFSDVDLDRFSNGFFQAVDNFLAPGSASAAFENATDAYTDTAEGRETLANLYSTNEIDWLFANDANDKPSPYTGSADQLTAAQTAFGQQMRAALATAYTTDTVVQYNVSWSGVPASIGDDYALFGTVVPSPATTLKGFTISSPTVPIKAAGTSTLTFLFGVPDVRDLQSLTLSLAWNVTHLEIFLVPSSQVPAGQARPSMWLQLVNPYSAPPQIGTDIEIPLVFRQYPTPPTVVSQQATQGSSQPPSGNELVDAAAWHFTYAYQVQLTPHDLINTSITYNTDLSATSGGGAQLQAAAFAGAQRYTLFEALARFSATYPVILPILSTPDGSSTWNDAAGVFRGLVNDVVNNTTWTPDTALLASARVLQNITDTYQVTDVEPPNASDRLITLQWNEQESSFSSVKLSVEALDPSTRQPYPGQKPSRITNGVTDVYTPVPPLQNDWVLHQVEADNLNVLFAENALSGMQVERNVIGLPQNQPQWFAKSEYVYKTPIVRATQPITPFVDNDTPIDVATLPNQNVGSGCPSAPPAGVASLCQRIYTLMFDLLADDSMESTLKNAMKSAGVDTGTERRLKVACSFQYPLGPVSPLVPVVLARSFLIDGSDPAQLGDFSSAFATAIAQWAAANDITLGPAAQPGAQFVFDLTLYAQLSGLNNPLLRLRNLQLKLTDVTP